MTEHSHAVNRDLIALGYRADDALIPLGDFVSVVIASPPMSAVRYAAEEGWSKADLLLAQHNERSFGLQYDRPGAVEKAEESTPIRPDGVPSFTPQSIDEYRKRRERLLERATDEAEKRIS